jgi:hypothetical protein
MGEKETGGGTSVFSKDGAIGSAFTGTVLILYYLESEC